ncbi:MAG TPA: MarR family transcriptional regulator [Candidatus Limosilactobacillus faecipullorum]|nr:MarR family transcriptional regulator [Candidatus Limosilactobacillus faecipullorum]
MKEDLIGLVAVFNGLIRRRIDLLVRPLGLSEANYYYLMIIGSRPGTNQAAITKKLLRDQSSVTRQIERLVKQGWVKKRRSTKDGRQSELFLTEKGQEVLLKLREITQQVNNEVSSKLSTNEDTILRDILQKARLDLD